jgi:hypothetical protein
MVKYLGIEGHFDMNEIEAKARKSVLASIFRRKKGNGKRTRLFEELDANAQSILVSASNLVEDELPVVGSFSNSDNWFFLTTKRIIWRVNGDRRELLTRTIVGVRLDDDAIKQNGAQVKATLQRLNVETTDHHAYSVIVEEGSPYFAILQVLINIMRRNRTKQEVE